MVKALCLRFRVSALRFRGSEFRDLGVGFSVAASLAYETLTPYPTKLGPSVVEVGVGGAPPNKCGW